MILILRFKIPFLALMMFILCISTVSASWAYDFVVNDGKVFVITEEVVDEVLIGKIVGKVTNYSSDETAYSGGNFSNAFPKGTKYYSIQGIPPEEAIAVKTNEEIFVKARYERDDYGGSDDTIQPKQHSEMAADNGIKDNSVIVLTVLLAAFAVLFMTIAAVVLNNRRI